MSVKIKHITAFILVVPFLITVSCKVQKENASKKSTSQSMVNSAPEWAAVWQQRASEYKALCFQAYNLASIRLDNLLQQNYSKPTAIVTDIDETVLDNSPYTVHQAQRIAAYSDSSWKEWTARVDCDTVPGALTFLNYAKSRGVTVYYITNRLEAERGATIKNLQKWNFPFADDSHLLMKTNGSGKEPRRQTVGQTHEILLLCGDNLSDFSQAFDRKVFPDRDLEVKKQAAQFGSKFIVLPNAMYGDWEGALYGFKYDLPASQKDSIIKSQLKTY